VCLASSGSPIRKNSRIEPIAHLCTKTLGCKLKNPLRLLILIKSEIERISFLPAPILPKLILHRVIIKIMRIPQNYKLFIKDLHDSDVLLFTLLAPQRSQSHRHHYIAGAGLFDWFLGLVGAAAQVRITLLILHHHNS